MNTLTRFLWTIGLMAYQASMPGMARAATDGKCPATKPPPDAKLVAAPPMQFLLSPAKPAPAFSGCQYLWLKDGTMLAARRFDRGSLVRADLFEPSAPPVSCHFGPKAVVTAGPQGKCSEMSGPLF